MESDPAVPVPETSPLAVFTSIEPSTLASVTFPTPRLKSIRVPLGSSTRMSAHAASPPPREVIFTFRPGDPLHARMQEPFPGAVNALRDAWQVAHPGEAHQPTLGVYDKVQWPGDPYASDFIFVTDDLGKRVEDVTVNGKTQASDHQPVLLRLRD